MTTSFEDIFPLRGARVHEVTGAGAFGFAAICCGQGQKAALWISNAAQPGVLNPVGLAPFCDPSRLLTTTGKNQKQVLALAEEALRSPAVGVVVTEVFRALDLVAARRLQLAAETGGTTGVVIMPQAETGGNALETRWHCAPVFDSHISTNPDSTLQHWNLIKNKTGTIGEWKVRWDAQTHRIIVVSKAGERPGSARPNPKPGG